MVRFVLMFFFVTFCFVCPFRPYPRCKQSVCPKAEWTDVAPQPLRPALACSLGAGGDESSGNILCCRYHFPAMHNSSNLVDVVGRNNGSKSTCNGCVYCCCHVASIYCYKVICYIFIYASQKNV